MQQHIRGFMHLDNGQESIPAFVGDSVHRGDIKYSYYREHTHALASGVAPGRVMAELFAKVDGTCKGAGGSMHIYDKETNFQGGWALVAEQLPYATGAARSILLDRHLDPEGTAGDDRLTIVFVGEGGAQNGRMAECLNAAAKVSATLLSVYRLFYCVLASNMTSCYELLGGCRDYAGQIHCTTELSCVQRCNCTATDNSTTTM
jgi:TPP-dependent pyruvate/acetoin dehydrogenase alpha subunit